MAKQAVALLAWNRGILSRYGLSRTDLRRAALSAEIFTNYMPSVLGSMMLRPGLAYISTILNSAVSIQIPFIFSTSDTALLEMTNLKMRVRVNDVLAARVAVTTVIAEGTFATLVSWTDADETSAVSDNTGGKLNLTGTGYNAAIRRQLVTVPGGDLNKRHALRIVIERGPVTFKAGSTAGGEEYITTTDLKAGTHSLTLTPTGNFYVEFSSTAQAVKYVTSIAIEAAGNLELPTIWTTSDLSKMRWDQSGDIIYVDCDGRAPQAIERRAGESWSIVEHFPLDGPFRTENITKTTIKASATAGDVTLTASKAVFKSGHVGALFQMTSNGQTVTKVLAGNDQYTDPVRISGVGNPARNYTVTITGTWVGTLTLQRSHDDGVTWTTLFNWTANVSSVETDTLDNQIVLYRIGFVETNYTSGSATVLISIKGGGITGVARITGYTSPTVVTAAVTEPLGGTNGTELWSEGAWSSYRGYPTAVALHDGRLFHAGRSSVWGSVSDAYESHDSTVEGDAGPINRTIGRGPVDNINWLLPLLRLVLGAQGAEISARSSSLDEPLTPTNFNLKASSTQGSDAVPPGIVDDSGFFVEKSGQKVFRLELIPEKVSYGSFDQSQFVPDLLFPGVTRIAVQRQPNTRLHCILGDGTAAVLVYDNLEEVECWLLVETDGIVEDIVVLPGDIEDQVYYVIARTIGGSTVRYLEKWAREDQARGGASNRLADSHVYYSGAATTTITGLGHAEGEEVIVWGNSKDLSPDDADGVQTTYTVTGGAISGLPEAVTTACVGLPYRARFKSAKMAYASELGTALTQTKKIHRLGLILCDAHPKAIQYGQDFDHLDSMPGIEEETDVIADALWTDYDKPNFPLNGTWDTDARLCLQTKAPRPVTVTCAVATVQTIEG